MNDTAATPEAQASEPATRKAGKAAKADASAAAARKSIGHLLPEKLELAEQKYNRWYGVAPLGTLPEDLDLQPEPFALIASLLHRGDDLRLFTADDSLMIDLVCVRAGPGYAICRVVQALAIPEAMHDDGARIPKGFEVRMATSGDTQPGWLVWRIASSGNRVDNILLNAGHHFETKEQAVRYLLDHATVRGETPQGVHRVFS
jgi:hypothetical protein